jgi:hypothetical protein
MDTTPSPESTPSVFRYVIGFLLIGVAWGFTTPFIRAAARTHLPPPHPILDSPSVKSSWIKSKFLAAFFGVVDLLRNPRYAIPLVINLTGSVWFFLLIGKAGEFPLSTFGVSGEGCGKWGAWGELEVGADVAKIELSLTVPITNSLAFLFTVFGDWWVERKVISRGKLFSSSYKPRINHQLLCRHLDWDGSFIIWNSALRPKQEQLILGKPILLH